MFNSILDDLATFDLFSNPSLEPTIFIVYAHDNNKEGEAHAQCVQTIIEWLRQIHAQILSDQFPVSDFDDEFNQGAISNIVDNQLCLLPPRTDRAEKPTRKSVQKVIVCGSDVLESYYNKPWVSRYIQDIVEIVKSQAAQPIDLLRSSLKHRVNTERLNPKSEFHHVVTELAFLELRTSHFEGIQRPHGMVPVSLKQDEDEAPMQYLPFFFNSDLKLKLKSLEKSSLHKLFFKLLEQLFPHHINFIKPFKKIYDSILDTLDESEEQLHSIIDRHITQLHKEYRNRSSVRMRSQQVEEYTGNLGKNVSKVLETTKLEKYQATLNWLSPINAPKLPRKYDNLETSRMEGTCDWIIEDEEFCRWRGHDGSALLFLCGDSE